MQHKGLSQKKGVLKSLLVLAPLYFQISHSSILNPQSKSQRRPVYLEFMGCIREGLNNSDWSIRNFFAEVLSEENPLFYTLSVDSTYKKILAYSLVDITATQKLIQCISYQIADPNYPAFLDQIFVEILAQGKLDLAKQLFEKFANLPFFQSSEALLFKDLLSNSTLNIYQQLSKNPTCKIFYELNLLLYIITHNPTENLQLIQFYPSSNKDKLLDWTVMEGPCDATWLYQVLQFSLDHHLKTSFIDALAKKLTIKDPEFIPMMELLLHNSRRRGALKKIKINEKEHISLNFRLAICHYTKNDEVQKIYREIVKILKNPQKRLLIFQKFLDLHQLEINLKTPVKILEKGYPSYFLMNAPIREQLEPIGELYRFCPRGNEDINHYHENNFYQYLVNHSLPLKSLSIDDFSEFFHFFQKSKFSTKSPPYFYEVLLIEYVHNQLEILSQTDPDAYLVNYASFLKSLESKLFSPSLNSTPQQDALKDVLTAAKMYGDPALFLESCYSKNKKSSFIYLSLGWKYLKYFLPAENFLQLFPKFSKSTNQDLLNHPQLLNIILKADLNQVRDLINDPKLQHYQALEIKDGLLAKTYKNPLELALGVKFILDCYHLFPIELLPEDQDCIIQSTHKFCPNLKDYSLKQEDHDQTSLLNKLKDIYEDPSFSHNLKAIIENYYITLLSLPVVEFDQMEYLLEMMIGIFHHKINKTTIDFQLVKRLEMLKTNISVDWGTEQKDRIIKMFEKLDKYINPSLKRKASEALEEAPESKKQKLVS